MNLPFFIKGNMVFNFGLYVINYQSICLNMPSIDDYSE